MMQLKRFLCLLLVLLLCLIQMQSKTNAQEGLSLLEILISDLQESHDLIEQGENKSAITILKNAQKIVRKVKEFNAKTKSITLKRIKKGIQLLKNNENEEALDLLQTAFDALEEEGLI